MDRATAEVLDGDRLGRAGSVDILRKSERRRAKTDRRRTRRRQWSQCRPEDVIGTVAVRQRTSGGDNLHHVVDDLRASASDKHQASRIDCDAMRICATAQRDGGPIGAGHVVDANDGGRRTARVSNVNPAGHIHGNADGIRERIDVTADDGRLRQRGPSCAGQIVHANDALVTAIGNVNHAVGVERHRR